MTQDITQSRDSSILSQNQKIVFSGAQPTGTLTLGNYLGAIKNWVKLQESYKCFFCAADLHAITILQSPQELQKAIKYNIALYIAAGLDPEKSVIFQQSTISAHSELAWILGCLTQIGWLNRMIQFKEKAKGKNESVFVGLYTYPILQAADILLYKTNYVPIGEDQKQHIELTRDIAGSFNRHLQQDYFVLPEAVIDDSTAKIMSLRDPNKKMSKSDPVDASRINLTDNTDIIAHKIKKAKTDSIEGIWYDIKERPEIANLLHIYSGIVNTSIENAVQSFTNMTTSQLKTILIDALIQKLVPLQKLAQDIVQDTEYLHSIIQQGTQKASVIAGSTLQEVKHMIGF